ncbi:MAG: hypothetical protein COT06_12750 [Syntrophobacteraceae bacterium CG07_land_8_20_14_0_80_61_8]|nr:MAG: hypothetical protein COT06_12750 [Syntrophobacteraceae bacterium CG07_land_8_20_14_0_80_61_8]
MLYGYPIIHRFTDSPIHRFIDAPLCAIHDKPTGSSRTGKIAARPSYRGVFAVAHVAATGSLRPIGKSGCAWGVGGIIIRHGAPRAMGDSAAARRRRAREWRFRRAALGGVLDGVVMRWEELWLRTR